jgi:hypothetical protein
MTEKKIEEKVEDGNVIINIHFYYLITFIGEPNIYPEKYNGEKKSKVSKPA